MQETRTAWHCLKSAWRLMVCRYSRRASIQQTAYAKRLDTCGGVISIPAVGILACPCDGHRNPSLKRQGVAADMALDQDSARVRPTHSRSPAMYPAAPKRMGARVRVFDALHTVHNREANTTGEIYQYHARHEFPEPAGMSGGVAKPGVISSTPNCRGLAPTRVVEKRQ